jgi:hypothetical protein
MKALRELWRRAPLWRVALLAAATCTLLLAWPPPSRRSPSSGAAHEQRMPAGAASAGAAVAPAVTPAVASPVTSTTPRRDPPGAADARAIVPSKSLRADELPPERAPKPADEPVFRGRDQSRLRPSGPAELLKPAPAEDPEKR